MVARSRWRVGNGRSIQIWKDRWLPRPTTLKIVSHSDRLLEDTIVDYLIDNNRRTWKQDILQELFWPDEIELIKSIPIGDTHNKDKFMWHFTKNGFFSVRSAYHLIKQKSGNWQNIAFGSNRMAKGI